MDPPHFGTGNKLDSELKKNDQHLALEHKVCGYLINFNFHWLEAEIED